MSGKQRETAPTTPPPGKKNKNKSLTNLLLALRYRNTENYGSMLYVTWVFCIYLSFRLRCDPATLIICTCVASVAGTNVYDWNSSRASSFETYFSFHFIRHYDTHRVPWPNEFPSFGSPFVIVLSFQLKWYFPKRNLAMRTKTSKTVFAIKLDQLALGIVSTEHTRDTWIYANWNACGAAFAEKKIN